MNMCRREWGESLNVTQPNQNLSDIGEGKGSRDLERNERDDGEQINAAVGGPKKEGKVLAGPSSHNNKRKA